MVVVKGCQIARWRGIREEDILIHCIHMLDQPAIEDGEEEELFSRVVLKTQSLILSTSAVEIVWT